MELKTYLKNAIAGQIDNHRFFETRVYLKPGEQPPKGVNVQTGPNGGKFFDTAPGHTVGSYKPDILDNPKLNYFHPENHKDDKELVDRYSKCHEKSLDFVKKNGGEVFTTTNNEHSIAIKDDKVYDYVYGINGMPKEEYFSKHPHEFKHQDLQEFEKLVNKTNETEKYNTINKNNVINYVNKIINKLSKDSEKDGYSMNNRSFIQKSIPKDFKVFEISEKKMKPTGEIRFCYNNSMKVAKDNPKMKLAIGIHIGNLKSLKTHGDFALIEDDKKRGFMPPFVNYHAWNIDENGKVYDVTYGNDGDNKNELYIGKIVDVNNFKDDSELEDYLWRTFLDYEPPSHSYKTNNGGK